MEKYGILIIQLYVYILRVSPSMLQSEYSIKLYNTENIILTLGDLDDDVDNDLEMIKSGPDEILDKRLNWFHKFIEWAGLSKKSEEKFYSTHFLFPQIEVQRPTLTYEIPYRTPRQKFKKKKKFWLKRWRMRRGPNNAKRDLENQETTTTGTEVVEADLDITLQKEYEDYVAQSRENETAFKYTDEGKPEENVKDVIRKITDMKVPENCTNVKGIGVQAVECLVKDMKIKEMPKRELANKICLILIVWMLIYGVIVVPLWCTKGWCCCCCPCEFCYPRERVTEIQKYIALNPPGVFLNEEGDAVQYVPTAREVELYEQIKKSIVTF